MTCLKVKFTGPGVKVVIFFVGADYRNLFLDESFATDVQNLVSNNCV